MTNESERAAFEKWAVKNGYELTDSDKDGHYFWERTADAWVVWQARSKLNTNPDLKLNGSTQGKANGDILRNSNAQIIAEQEKAEAVGNLVISLDRWYVHGIHSAIERAAIPSGEYPLYLHPAPSTDRVAAQGGDELVEHGAIVLWHRFGETNVEEWEDEVHQDEYRLAAEAVLALRATPADGDKLAKAIGDGV